MSLAELLDRHRVLVCVGSGGVGKTTVSAALALAAAERGKRTLCLTIDPARRLANSLGLEQMPTEQVAVSRAWLAEHGVELTGSLTVMMLDTKHTFDELVRRYAPNAEARQRILDNRLYRYVSTNLAGTQSYMAMEKVLMVEQDSSYDTIVLDTPPMQHALDFFEAPERMVEAIDSPALRGLVQAVQTSGRFSLNLVAKSIGAVLRTIGRITGGDLLEQMAEFVSSMNTLFGGFHDRAELVSREMRSPRFGYVVVSSPEKLTLNESEMLDDRMRERGLRASALVINRVHPAAGELPSLDEVRRLLDEEKVVLGPDGPERVLRAALEESELGAHDQAAIDAISESMRSRIPLAVRVPAFAVDVHHPERLHQVAKHLCGTAD